MESGILSLHFYRPKLWLPVLKVRWEFAPGLKEILSLEGSHAR